MSLFKYLIMGAAVAAGVSYVTRKREDGRSVMDDLSEKAPEWMDKAKQYADQLKGQYKDATSGVTEAASAENPLS